MQTEIEYNFHVLFQEHLLKYEYLQMIASMTHMKLSSHLGFKRL